MYIYICIYIIYTHTVYPLIGTELPSEGKGTARGTPFAFCTTFQKSPVLLNVPPLFSPSIKINLAHFFFMLPLPSPPLCSFMIADDIGKKVLHIEKFYKNFSCDLYFHEHNHDFIEKSLLKYLTSIKKSVQQHQK